MKTHFLLAAIAAIMLSIFANPVTGQNTTAGTRGVVIDIAVVMENNIKFKANLESIQTEIDAFDDTLDKKREEVKTKVE